MIQVRWLPCIATVEWHSGTRGLEFPLAIVQAHERVPVDVEASWVEGPAIAGEPARRIFVVRDASGERWRVTADEKAVLLVERGTS
jgi:hypothetical protein